MFPVPVQTFTVIPKPDSVSQSSISDHADERCYLLQPYVEVFKKLFTPTPPKRLLMEGIVVESERLSEELQVLIEKINFLQGFVKENQELEQLCTEYMIKYSNYIAFPSSLTDNLDEEDTIRKWTKLKKRVNEYQHYLNEYELFIERHEAIYQCFVKCLANKSESFSRKSKHLLPQQLQIKMLESPKEGAL